MARIESHRDLLVWQRGMELVEKVYKATAAFPRDERFRLISQATRAAVAVPANIAEGHARGTRRDYAQFVAIAKGFSDGARNLCHDLRTTGLLDHRNSTTAAGADIRVEPHADRASTPTDRAPNVEPGARWTAVRLPITCPLSPVPCTL